MAAPVKKYTIFIILYCVLAAAFTPARAELARIGMIHYTGNVESAGYLAGSLASAIDESLKQKFSYERISEEKINEAMAELSKAGIFDPRKIPEKNNLLRIAVALNADILIYGSYASSKSRMGTSRQKMKSRRSVCAPLFIT